MSDIGTHDVVIEGAGPDKAGRLGVGGRSDAHMLRHIIAELPTLGQTALNFSWGSIAANGGTATATAAFPQARAGMKFMIPPASVTAAFGTVHTLARVQAAECLVDGVVSMTAQNFNTASKTYNTVNCRNLLGVR